MRGYVSASRCVLTALFVLGCSGNIGEPGNGGRDPGSSDTVWHGGSAGDGANDAWVRDVAEADATMKAQNPELFEVALRYFPGQAPTGGAPRLARLTRTQLDATARHLLPNAVSTPLPSVMPRDPLQTNYEYADNLTFNASNFTPYTDWARAIAETTRSDPMRVIACSVDDAACLDAQARGFVARAFRGAAFDGQLDRFASFFTTTAADRGMPDAVVDLVDLTLSSPSFVFRAEVFTTAAGQLVPAARAQHLSYALADAPPEALGLSPDSAATDAAFDAALDAVLQSGAARDKLLRFFLAWLEVREPTDFAIATDVFPEFTPALAEAIVAQTREFLQRQLGSAAPSLLAITQADDAYVTGDLETMYGSAAEQQGTRLGVFTQPAVIASHSGPTTSRLVKRGVFFTRKVMCLPLGTPPEGVDTTVPTTPGATERERIESVTTPATCQGCHAFINPFGFMQESYDAIGRYRTEDEGLPVNPAVEIDFLDEPAFTTSTTVEALERLTSSLRFQQCFARQVFRFYMARNEGPGDDPLLRQMFFQFANGPSQDIVTMLRLLAGSMPFSNRTEAP